MTESALPPRSSSSRKTSSPGSSRKLTLWPLVAATYFMVSGGTYGTEDIVHGAGYRWALVILLLTPIVWSLPTAFMVGELSGALPEEGGFYAWVRRALGPFWGFQESWLSLTASVFDMAIYPTLFVAYLARLIPWVGEGRQVILFGGPLDLRLHGLLVGLGMVVLCALWNIAGPKAVGESSFWMFLIMLAPFVVITIFALAKHAVASGTAALSAAGNADIVGGVLVAMWNYMGWDNASTVAAEVERPQRTYPLAMIVTVALVALSYIIPIGAMVHTGIAPSEWSTGSWADLAARVAGPWLRVAVVEGGVISALGMFNALVMSYSRLPLAMARDRMLPAFFGKITPGSGAPWVSILVLATCWALCLGLGFKRLVTMDILLYGLSLFLEFAALVALRLREPKLDRPFRVPGGVPGTILVGVFPMLLLAFAGSRSERETIAGVNSLLFGMGLVFAGGLIYLVPKLLGIRSVATVTESTEPAESPEASG